MLVQQRLILYLGGFLAGLVIPHEGGFAIAIVEKLEDLISIILLPIVSMKLDSRKPCSSYLSISTSPFLE